MDSHHILLGILLLDNLLLDNQLLDSLLLGNLLLGILHLDMILMDIQQLKMLEVQWNQFSVPKVRQIWIDSKLQRGLAILMVILMRHQDLVMVLMNLIQVNSNLIYIRQYELWFQ